MSGNKMANNPLGVDWQALFFDPDEGWPARLQTRTKRRFGDSADADAAYNFALDEVSRNDWARLSAAYTGRGSAGGFLAVTLANLLEEYAVRKYGKKRPPAWVSRLGTLWTRVHQMQCLQRLAPESIVDHLCARAEHEPDDVRYAIREIRRRVRNCGAYIGESNLDSDHGMDSREDTTTQTPAEQIAGEEFAQVIGLLRHMVGTETTQIDHDTAMLASLRACLLVPDSERLLLKLMYHEGHSLPKAAKTLKIHEQKARRSHRTLLQRLRKCLNDNGF